MLFTYDTIDKEYRTGAAASSDGLVWHRDDTLVGIERASHGWDSEMVCYPVRLAVGNKAFTFYSGNGMGRTGFGYAEWVDD